MRGNKRRAAAFVTAANKAQPALNDAILDVVNRKAVRSCVECGATSTPQWREGPMGPKTLCNACGVRRQRLLRKQQAASVGTVPTAPVAAVQARRRMAGRPTLQAPTMESDDLPYGGVSGSEHSSDETEVDWAAGTPSKQNPQPHRQHNHHQQLHQQRRQLQQQQLQLTQEVDESCNEDESAAYDLLFFAGVERGAGSGGGLSGGGGDWRSEQQQLQHHDQLEHLHDHNTRRHVQPVHRSDDFYYYEEDEAPGMEGGEEEDDSCKRRKVALQPTSRPRPHGRPWLVGSSFSSSEDVADSQLSSHRVQHEQQRQSAAPIVGGRRQTPAGPDGTQSSPLHSSPAAAATTTHASSATAPSAPAAPSFAAGSNSFAPLFGLPVALPVLPLSLSLPTLPAVSGKDYEMMLKLQLDFQRACMQLQQANVQCEAVGAVVEEHRQAAANAHEQAAAASQQLAAEARAVADKYRLRDVLSELHAATGGAAEGGVEAAAAGAATGAGAGAGGQQLQ